MLSRRRTHPSLRDLTQTPLTSWLTTRHRSCWPLGMVGLVCLETRAEEKSWTTSRIGRIEGRVNRREGREWDGGESWLSWEGKAVNATWRWQLIYPARLLDQRFCFQVWLCHFLLEESEKDTEQEMEENHDMESKGQDFSVLRFYGLDVVHFLRRNFCLLLSSPAFQINLSSDDRAGKPFIPCWGASAAGNRAVASLLLLSHAASFPESATFLEERRCWLSGSALRTGSWSKALVKVWLAFEEANSGIVGHTESVHCLDNLQEATEVAGHVILTLRADVLEAVGCGWCQMLVL